MVADEVVSRMKGLTLSRVQRSLRVRALRAFGRMEAVRMLARGTYRGNGPVQSSLFPDVDPAAVAQTLEEDGLCLGLKLPPQTLAELRDFAEHHPCFGNRNPQWGFYPKDRAEAEAKAGKAFTLARYHNTSVDCPAARALMSDPVLHDIAKRYVGSRAKLVGMQMWWSFVSNAAEEERDLFAQLFHFDLDDYRFLKFFFYLTDVDATAGPHVYVKGTHRSKRLRHMYPMRRLGDAEVEDTYGRDRVITIEGRAGEGFAEDTFGLHKGAPPSKTPRLLFQMEFAINSYGFSEDTVDPSRLGMLLDKK
jgi:hypothetical protein